MNLENRIMLNLIKYIPFGIIVSDLEGTFIYYNEVANKAFNYEINTHEKSRWIGDLGVYSLNGTKYEHNEVPIKRSLRGEIVQAEKVLVKSKINTDGVYLKIYSYPVYTDDNIIEGAVSIFEDITKEEVYLENIIGKITNLESYIKDTLNIDYETIINRKNGK